MRLRPTCARTGALGGHGAVNQKGSRAEIDTENGEEEEEEDDDDDRGEGATTMVAKSAVGRSVRAHAQHKGKTRGTSQTFEEDLPVSHRDRTFSTNGRRHVSPSSVDGRETGWQLLFISG